MCLTSFSSRSQQISFPIAPLASRVTPMASEQASTQTVNSFLSMHQSPYIGSSRVTLAMVSVSMLLRVASCTSSSHPDITEVACYFMAVTATMSDDSGMSPPLHQESLSPLQLMCNHSTFTPSWRD